MKSAFPLVTPEWSAWSATKRTPRIEGVWAISGHEPGMGPFFGQVTIAGNGAIPLTSSQPRAASLTPGRAARSNGKAASVIYTGFQWRGRSTIGADDATSLREVMNVDRDWQTIAGRWFSGSYDETGADVQLTRIGRNPIVLGVEPSSVVRGATVQIRIFGANLPASATPRDLDFGQGVTVTRVVSATPDIITVEIAAQVDAPIGTRDVFVAGASERAAVAVYDTIHYIKVAPAWNMARVGGVVFPKMLAQFEAVGYHNGPDGKPETKDDVQLGVVDATWSIEEYTATFDDDDRAFVGKIDAATGLFTPAEDGPNPNRSGNRNNVGDVWIVATSAAVGGSAPLRARAHLVVTVPLYMRWDFFTVGQR